MELFTTSLYSPPWHVKQYGRWKAIWKVESKEEKKHGGLTNGS